MQINERCSCGAEINIASRDALSLGIELIHWRKNHQHKPADNSSKPTEPLTADGDFKVADNAEAYEQVGWLGPSHWREGTAPFTEFSFYDHWDGHGEPVYRKATQ